MISNCVFLCPYWQQHSQSSYQQLHYFTVFVSFCFFTQQHFTESVYTKQPSSQAEVRPKPKFGALSHVLTATPRSYGKGQNSTLCKIETPERISTKFGTVDYVPEICRQTKFGDNRVRGASRGICEIYTLFLTFFTSFCSRTDLEVTSPNQFSRKVA